MTSRPILIFQPLAAASDMGQSSGEVIAITVVFTALELSSVGLRLWARRITGAKGGGMGLDDIFAVLAAVIHAVHCGSVNKANGSQFLFVLGLAVPIIIRMDGHHQLINKDTD